MDIDTSLEADAQLAHAREPGMSALGHPAVSPQPIIALDAFAGDAGRDPSSFEMRTTELDVAGLVGMQFVRPASRPPPLAGDRRQRIDQRLEHHRIMPIAPVAYNGRGDRCDR